MPGAAQRGKPSELRDSFGNVQVAANLSVSCLRVNYTTAQTDTAIVSAGASERILVSAISATCDNANTVDVGLTIGFGAANTPTGAGVVLTHPGIPKGLGVAEGDGSGIIGVGAAGEDLRITSEVPTTGSISVRVTYLLFSVA